MYKPNHQGADTLLIMRMALIPAVLIWCAVSSACSGETGARSAETALLLEGAGLEKLRIGKATVAEAASYLGINTIVWMDTLDNGQGEFTTPQLLRLAFRTPETGEGPPVLYAVRAQLAAPIYDGETAKGLGYYTGKTSKGIGFLDSLDAVHAAYGRPEAEWIGDFDRFHYYADEGVIFTTRHPQGVDRNHYAAARSALGKRPDEGPGAAVVTGIMVVPPFSVTDAPNIVSAGQRVVSSPPETTLRVSVF